MPASIDQTVLKGARSVCYEAKDKFFACVDVEKIDFQTGSPIPEACKRLREEYEKACKSSWVTHFDKLRENENPRTAEERIMPRERSRERSSERHTSRHPERSRLDRSRSPRSGRDKERFRDRDRTRERDRDADRHRDRPREKDRDRDRQGRHRNHDRENDSRRPEKANGRSRDEEPEKESRDKRGDVDEPMDITKGNLLPTEEAAPLRLDADISPEEMQMMQAMGIPFGFDTTQGRHIEDEKVNTGAVKVKQKRRARQYMNRRGGFNRSLPTERTGQTALRD